MRNELDSAFLEADRLIKRGKRTLAENAGKTVAVITAAVTALVTFTEVGIGGFLSSGSITDALILIIASYLMYFSLGDAGKRTAMATEEFRAASAALDNARGRVGGEMIGELRQFCLDYSSSELEYRKRRMAKEFGLSDSDLLSPPDRRTKRLKRRLNRQKMLKITPRMLLCGAEYEGNTELSAPHGAKAKRTVKTLLPSTAAMLFTVSVILSTKDGLTAASVAEGLLRLSCLPIIGLRGYTDGYGLALGAELSWIRARVRLLDAFFKRSATSA